MRAGSWCVVNIATVTQCLAKGEDRQDRVNQTNEYITYLLNKLAQHPRPLLHAHRAFFARTTRSYDSDSGLRYASMVR